MQNPPHRAPRSPPSLHEHSPRRRARALLSLSLCACTPSSEHANAELAAGVERTNARLDAVDERLAAIDAKLDRLAELEAKPTPPPAPPSRPPPLPSSSPIDAPSDLAAGLRCEDDVCVLKRELWLEVGGTEDLAKMARLVPKYDGNKPLGFKLFGIRSNSLLRHLGFNNGDMVTAINGRPLRALDDLVTAYERAKHADEVVIDYERKHKSGRLTVVIE